MNIKNKTTTTTTTTAPVYRLFSMTTWVSRYQKSKTRLDLNEAKDDGVWECSGISWIICKQSSPRSRQITILTPHQENNNSKKIKKIIKK